MPFRNGNACIAYPLLVYYNGLITVKWCLKQDRTVILRLLAVEVYKGNWYISARLGPRECSYKHSMQSYFNVHTVCNTVDTSKVP
jgi:hypothetical protein